MQEVISTAVLEPISLTKVFNDLDTYMFELAVGDNNVFGLAHTVIQQLFTHGCPDTSK